MTVHADDGPEESPSPAGLVEDDGVEEEPSCPRRPRASRTGCG
jgi:hypothetical protein